MVLEIINGNCAIFPWIRSAFFMLLQVQVLYGLVDRSIHSSLPDQTQWWSSYLSKVSLILCCIELFEYF